MFFTRMVARSFSRQLRKRLLIALTVGLSAAVSVAMLGVVFDVGDKLTAELTTYGSNIVV
ncbi:MAG: ABC transporter permease, partial [Bifidobacterium boum]|nr:ABC transporter permease [Bifidobacterium boum]